MTAPTAPAAAPPLAGDYPVPALRPGDRAYCRLRRAWCRVTGWDDAPIRWPRAVRVGATGRPSLVVDEALERAVLAESSSALIYWFGLSPGTVARMRRAFGVGGLFGTRGSRDLHRSRCRPGRPHPDLVAPSRTDRRTRRGGGPPAPTV